MMYGFFVLVQISLPGCFVRAQVTNKYSGHVLPFVLLELALLCYLVIALITI